MRTLSRLDVCSTRLGEENRYRTNEFMKAIHNTISDKTAASTEIDEAGQTHRRMRTLSHPLGLGTCSTEYMYGKHRGVYSEEELDVKLTHVKNPKRPATKSPRPPLASCDFVSTW
mmetsp:Transcript_27643/g.41841  ORF Transcript_27643/g.41841 Transcript_27643/m.41841 type:complete len:115 (+) Transcript_27643:575-919(+)